MRRTLACFFFLTLAALPAGRWRFGSPVTHQNLTLYPVLSDQTGQPPSLLTLDEGLASGKVEVREMESGAQVNRLALVNRSGRPLIVLAGEIIIGGKQDRMMSRDAIIPTGDQPVNVDVYCVERGRWQGRQSHFGALHAIVNPAVREQAVAYKSQQGVWAGVGETARRLAPMAASTSYAEVYREAAPQSLQAEYEKALRAAFAGKSAVGVVAEINKRTVWADVFGSPALFEKYWPKLLASYAVEAAARRGQAAATTNVTAQQFLERAAPGATLLYGGRPVHFAWLERQ